MLSTYAAIANKNVHATNQNYIVITTSKKVNSAKYTESYNIFCTLQADRIKIMVADIFVC